MALLSFLPGPGADLAGIAIVLLAIACLDRRVRTRPRRDWRGSACDVAPPEPGWTETLGEEDCLAYGRGGRFHPELMRQDARGRRGEFATHGEA
ncbi:MAG TPA: hypothetical protein VFW19_11805 [Allosphingosinicella sp.]|nr:hypothetical protein [Allosphingosinicella sp.]